MLSALIVLSCLTGLAVYYYTILKPEQNLKRKIIKSLSQIDLYYVELDRVTTLIQKSANKEQISKCCNEVYEFRTKYLYLQQLGVPVQADVDEFIESIDKRYYEIKLRKPSFI